QKEALQIVQDQYGGEPDGGLDDAVEEEEGGDVWEVEVIDSSKGDLEVDVDAYTGEILNVEVEQPKKENNHKKDNNQQNKKTKANDKTKTNHEAKTNDKNNQEKEPEMTKMTDSQGNHNNDQGGSLPDTAGHMYNWIILGFL